MFFTEEDPYGARLVTQLRFYSQANGSLSTLEGDDERRRSGPQSCEHGVGRQTIAQHKVVVPAQDQQVPGVTRTVLAVRDDVMSLE